MYRFFLKDNGSGLDIIITRALLALAGLSAFVIHANQFYYLHVIGGIFLLLLAAFAKLLLVRYKVSSLVLLIVSSLVLFIATGSAGLGLILLLYGTLFKYLYKTPFIEVSTAGIEIRKTLSTIVHPWSMFNNVVLKDSVLTLDFKNNKLMQLNTEDSDIAIDENLFNQFCNRFIDRVSQVGF